MNQTNDLRGRLGYLEDLAFLAVQAFIAADDAGLADALSNLERGAADTLKQLQPGPKK